MDLELIENTSIIEPNRHNLALSHISVRTEHLHAVGGDEVSLYEGDRVLVVIQDFRWLGNDARTDVRDFYITAGSTRTCGILTEGLDEFFGVESSANRSLFFRHHYWICNCDWSFQGAVSSLLWFKWSTTDLFATSAFWTGLISLEILSSGGNGSEAGKRVVIWV